MDDEVNNFNDIEVLENRELGSGYISRVKLGRHRHTQKSYAIKLVI